MMINKFIAAAMIFSAFILPGFQIISGLPVIRCENILVFLILVYRLLLIIVRGMQNSIDMDQVTKGFIFMAYMAIISITLPVIVFDTNFIINDTMILPMLFTYWMIYRLFQSIYDVQSRLFCLNAILGAVALCAGIGVMQHFNLLGINYWFTPFYSKGNQISSLTRVINEAAGARIGGTHGDPRHYGYLLVVGLCLCTSWLLHIHGKKYMQCFVILTVGMCFVSIAFTLSRTTILSTAVCIPLALFLYMRKNRSYSKAIVTIIILIFISSALSSIYYTESFQERIMRTDTSSFENSRHARIRDLLRPFKDALDNPIIFLVGRGPSKAEMRTSSHNDIGWYFHRFGLPGLYFYISLFISGLKRTYFSYNNTDSNVEKTIILASFLVMINWVIFAMAENIFKDGQLMAVNFAFMGLVYSLKGATISKAKKRLINIKY